MLQDAATATPSVTMPIGVGIVTDKSTTARTLSQVLETDRELLVLGTHDESGADALLQNRALRVLLVNLSLTEDGGTAPGVRFIRRVKQERPDVGVLSLKRQVDEHQLRAALDAGADACCLAIIPSARLRKAIKVVADGATWLDAEVAHALFHHHDAEAETLELPHLSPRERQVLRLLVEGYTNEEMARHLECSHPTVRTHLAHLYRKLDVDDRVSAAVFALRHGLT